MHRRRHPTDLGRILVAGMLWLAVPLAQGAAYSIPDSEIVDLPRSGNGVTYQLYLHVPAACRARSARCPVFYMLDAEYSFALAATQISHLAERNRIPDVISVAIGYPDKSRYRADRSRDYTPWFEPDGGYGPAMQKASGGGPAFLTVIAEEIVPHVEARYGTPPRRALVGHSYGGLFAVQAWLRRPALFDDYVIVSPSLWYGDGRTLAQAREACQAASRNGQARLFLAVGAFEEQPQRGRAMVSDLRALDAILADCPGRAPQATLRVHAGETHASIFPAAFSSGLRWLLQ